MYSVGPSRYKQKLLALSFWVYCGLLCLNPFPHLSVTQDFESQSKCVEHSSDGCYYHDWFLKSENWHTILPGLGKIRALMKSVLLGLKSYP